MKLLKTFGVAACLLLSSTQAVHAERIAFGATNSQSSHYAYFAALSKVVQDRFPELQTSVVETGATVDNLKRMQRNQVDAGEITTSSL